MVQILVMLKVLFTWDARVGDLFCCVSSGSEPGCSSAIISSAGVAGNADGSVVLAS